MSPPEFQKSPYTDYFVRLLRIIFGVVVAQGIIKHGQTLFSWSFSLRKLLPLFSFAIVYMLVILSWIFYHHSITLYPYRKSYVATVRATFDLIIIFTYVYLIFSIPDTFDILLGAAVVFMLYAITGILRVLEWRDKRVSRWRLSLIFSGVLFIMYYVMLPLQEDSQLELIVEFVVNIKVLSLLVVYRYLRKRLGYPKFSIIGVDIDGVLGDQVQHILRYMREKEGRNIDLTEEDIREWDYPIGGSTISDHIERALLHEEFVITMPVVKCAKNALKLLYERYHLVIISNRPKEAQKATKQWLKSNNLKFHETLWTRETGKAVPGVDILIDDNIENIKMFVSHSPRSFGILFLRPWNRQTKDKDRELQRLIGMKRVFCCNGWGEVLRAISNMTS
ncbi:MAG: hypothetical protein DRN91_07240 [Candidatus Alkanophagales archaeon]|nr:MAG: hypothetical protein DRN91_07240 [Candidatus Alkanophagales archaeon]